MRSPILVTCAAVALLAAACANSTSAKQAAVPTTKPGAPPITEVSGAELHKNIPLTGVQGVTTRQIDVAVITAGTNPLAGDYTTFADGIQAYFDMINSEGGIYGRQLVISAKHDDQFVNDEQTVKASLAQDHAFATFIATALFGGAPDIATSNPPMPTFTWNINQEFAGKPNLFGSMPAICFTCKGQTDPYIAQEEHFTRVAALAYGAIAASKNYAAGVKASFEKYPSARVAYFDPNLQVGQADVSAEVTRMKEAKVQLVFTSIDQRETLIIAKEMAKQHLDAVQYVNNLYNPQFVHDNAQYLEGAFVAPQFAALENTPQLPVEQEFVKWMGKSGKPVSEIPGYGWIDALQFVHGLELAGPSFSQQKVIDSLNQDTHFDAEGMIVPIDWTKQHNDPAGANGTANRYAGSYQCVSLTRVRNGKFVPVLTEPGKPWVCMVGGSNAPRLTKNATFENFADTAG
jgi:ABC-type branched-subunit amino acid transport system substrate-binding protein